MYFLFVATDQFVEHDRVKHVPWMETGQEIFNFIYSCDAMLHARMAGETFGLAIAEFSIAGKPVITWSGRGHQEYDSCHLELLGDRALLYDAYDDLLELLLNFDSRRVADGGWDRYSETFNTRDVMRKFAAVFLV
jgi:glycosyltransferase involved in cell wall biosynthesis